MRASQRDEGARRGRACSSLHASPTPFTPHLTPGSILLRKIQSTKPEVTKFTRGGISVRNQPMGLDGGGGGGAGDGGGSPGKRERPKWVDPTSSEAPSARGAGAGAGRREAGSGGAGGGGIARFASGRTRTFKDPANIA